MDLSATERRKLLFLCTGNSCRSQMAEALAKALHGDHFDFYSAGIVAHGMNPNVEAVMEEVGISMQGHYSKTLEQLSDVAFDYVVTVCDHASDHCPAFPATVSCIHQPFPDPPRLAREDMSEEQRLDCYRQVRDQIRLWLTEQFPAPSYAK
ncbi:arsenate reductase ArsC [Hahella ganghwensis]|uniref:arsenate reductase ArsC n=1 Tax=Hahella ganghwensis TaxID=286420 RepID=UPI00036936B1|nr:arsenate reductase ArsC [Hahella ganghwensis]